MKNLFEKFYKVLGHNIILKFFGNNEYYLEILKMDLFAKFMTFWPITKLQKILGKNVNF